MNVLACDMGGTRVKAAVVAEGRIRARTTVAAHSHRPMRECLASLADAFRHVSVEAAIRPDECQGIALSFPSLVDPATGWVLDSYGKYRDAPRTDLAGWARAEFGLPLAVENDARMALIGEWRHGAGRGCDDLVMVTLGTGGGVAAIMEGRAVRGRHGQAAVMGGHLGVRYGGRACACGNVGCAEAETSLAFLREIAGARPDFAASGLRSESEFDYEALFRHARTDDPCARALADHSVQVWGALVVSLIHAFDPRKVILGGGIMAAADQVLLPIGDYVDRHAHTPWGKVEIVPSELGDDAAIMAAEWLVDERMRAR
jgi:glucokinase